MISLPVSVAHVDGETDIHMDESELKLAEWKTREELELQPDDFSLTNEMMLMFKKMEECKRVYTKRRMLYDRLPSFY